MNPVVQIIDSVLGLFKIALFIWCVLSWFPNVNRREPPVVWLDNIIQPVMRPIQKVIPPIGNIDVSPIVLIVALQFLTSFIDSILLRF